MKSGMPTKFAILLWLLCIVGYIQAQSCPTSFTLSTSASATTSSKIALIFNRAATYSCTYCYGTSSGCNLGATVSSAFSTGSVTAGSAVLFPPSSSGISLDSNTGYYIACTCGSVSSATSQFTKPSAPVVSATATASSINLSWTAVGGVGTIRAYRVCTSGTNCVVLTGSPPATTYTVSGLNPATTYNFLVAAMSQELNTFWGDNGARAAVTLITAPTSVSIISSSTSNVGVSWTMSNSYSNIGSDFIKYTICLSPGGLCEETTNVAATSIIFSSGLNSNVAYTATVSAVSNQNTAATTSSADPTPPATLTISQLANSATANSVTITWTDNSSNLGTITYRLCTALDGCGMNAITSPYTITSLPASNAQYYDFFIRSSSSVAGAGKTVDSSFVVSTGPGPVVDLSVSSRTTTSLDFYWSAPDGGIDYTLTYEICCTGSASPICQTTSDTFIGFAFLSVNTAYSCTIKSTSSVGTSTTSSPQDFSTTPSTVTSFSQSGTATSTSFALSWDAIVPGNPTSGPYTYTVCISGDVGCVTTSSNSLASYTHASITGNTDYTMQIFVTDNYGQESAVATTTATTAPNTPSTLSFSSRTASSLSVTWTASPAGALAITYTVTCTDDYGSPSSSSSANSLTLNSLNSGTIYSCTNTASNSKGSSSASSAVFMRTSPSAVSSLSKTAVSTTSITLSWNAVSGGSPTTGPYTYKVCLQNEQSCQSAGSSLTKEYTGLSQDTSYTLEVFAIDSAGVVSSASSNTASTVPSGVTSLVASSRTTTSISFTWSALSNQQGLSYTYNVCCRAGAAATPTCKTSTSTSLLFDNLSASTKYTCNIGSTTSAGTGPTGNDQDFTTTPSAPASLSVSNPTSTSFDLSWPLISPGTPTSGPYTYKICLASTTSCTTSSGPSITISSSLIPAITGNTQYSLVIQTVDSDNQLSATTSATATTLPSTPNSLSYVSSSANSISLSWTASPTGANAITYRVCCSDSVTNVCGTSSIASITLSTLSAGTIYNCNNQAITTIGSSSTTSSSSFRTAPASPSNVVQSSITSTTVSLTWSAVTGGNPTTAPYTYKVCRSGETSCQSASSNSHTYTGLTANTVYTLEVYTLDSAGNLQSTGTSKSTTATLPNGVGSLSVTSRTTSSLAFSWTTPSGGSALSYNYLVCCTAAPTPAICQSTTSTSTSFTGLDDSTLYTCNIATSTTAGSGSTSTSQSFSTIPAQVTNLNYNSVTTSSFDLTWTPITPGTPTSGPYSYSVCKTDMFGAPFGCITTPQGASSVTYTSVTGNTRYDMQVRTVDSHGQISSSATTTVTTLPNGVTNLYKIYTEGKAINFGWGAPVGGSALTYTFVLCCTSDDTLICKRTSALSMYMEGLAHSTLYSCNVATSTVLAAAPTSSSQNFRTLPAAVTGQDFLSISNNAFSLDWNYITPGTPTSGPFVYRICETGGFNCINTNLNSATYSSGLFVGNTVYSMEIRTMDQENQLSSAVTVSAVTGPDVPSSLAVTSRTASSITFNWTPTSANAAVITYHICCHDSSSTTCGSTTSSSITLSNLVAGTAYSCTNNATTYYGISGTTSPASFNTLPATPTSVSQTGITASSVSLSWDNVPAGNPTSGGFSYKVCRVGETSCQSTSTNSITYTGLIANTVYTLYVFALDSSSIPLKSSSASITTSPTLPNGVTSFSSTTRTGTSISLSWTSPSGGSALQYSHNVCCSDTVGSVCQVASNSATSATVPSLREGTLFTCTIATSTSAGTGPVSTSQSYRTYPAAVTPISQTSATPSQVTLAWPVSVAGNPSSAPYSYEVCKQGLIDCVTTTSSTSHTYGTNLSPNTAYNMVVKTIDQDAQYTTSSVFSAVTAPAAAGALSASSRTVSSITLSWTAPSTGGSAQTIIYEVCLVGPNTCQQTTSLSITFTGLTIATRYSFTIRTYNTAGSGPTSAQQSFATLPPVPANFRATSATTSQLHLSWNAVSGSTGTYKYRVCKQGGISCTAVTTGTTLTYSSGLSANSAYSLEIQSQDSDNIFSNVGTVTTGTAPSTPSITVHGSSAHDEISFGWSSVNSGNLPFTYVACITPTSRCTTYTSSSLVAMFNQLSSNTAYSATVYANNTYFAGSTSSSTTINSRSNAVRNLAVTQRTTNSVSLSWSVPLNAGSLPLFYRVCDVNDANMCQTVSSTSAITSGLINSNYYQFSVQAFNTPTEYSVAETIGASTIPVAPTNFVKTASTVTSIVVAWNVPVTTGSWNTFTYTVCLVDTGFCQTTADRFAVFGQLGYSSFYDFTLRANNGQDDSAAVTLTASTRPPQPFNFEATTRTDTSILLIWNTTVTSTYDLCLVELDQCVHNVPLDSHSFINLSPNTLYTFNLTETNMYGSNSSIIQAATIPNTPALFSVDHVTASTLDFVWSSFAAGNIDYARISVCPIGALAVNSTYCFVTMDGTTVRGYLTNLVSSNTDNYEVIATTIRGDSSIAKLVSGSTMPPTITNLQFVRSTNDSIQVGWNALEQVGNDGAITYTLCIAPSICVSLLSVETNNYTFSNVVVSSYQYTAVIYSVNGRQLQSDTTSVKVDTLPSAPFVSFYSNSRHTITIQLEPSTVSGTIPLRNYLIELDGKLVANVLQSQTWIYELNQLIAGQSYQIDVRLDNENNGISAATTVVYATQEPIVPVYPIITSTSTSYNTISLNWTRPSYDGGRPIIKYILTYYQTLNRQQTLMVDETNRDDVTHTIQNVIAGTNYTVELVAMNRVGLSNSSIVTVMTVPPITPDAPIQFSVSNIKQRLATLTWTPPTFVGGTPIKSYELNVTGPTGRDAVFATQVFALSAQTLQFNLTTLVGSSSYNATLKSTNMVGDSMTASLNFDTLQSVAPQGPSGIVINQLTHTMVNISWSAPADDGGQAILGYDIEVSTQDDQSATAEQASTVVISTDASASSVIVDNLAPNTQYRITMYSRTSTGRSAASNPNSIITFGTPSAPQDIAGVAAGIAVPLILVIIFLVIVLVLVIIIVAIVVIVILVRNARNGVEAKDKKSRFTLDRPAAEGSANI